MEWESYAGLTPTCMPASSLLSIRIQNVRSLADTGHVRLLPLTLLVGRNSSGKSTFLRSFPLLRQSVERETTGPILWFGSLVDFGSHETAVRKEAVDEGIRLTFRARLSPTPAGNPFLFGDVEELLDPVEAEVEIGLESVGEDGKTVATTCQLRVGDDEADLTFMDDEVIKFIVNGADILKTVGPYIVSQGNGLVPVVLPVRRTKRADGAVQQTVDPRVILPRFRTATNPLFYGNTSAYNRDAAANNISYGKPESILKSMQTASEVPSWKRRIGDLTTSSPKFERIRSLVFVRAIPHLLRLVDTAITELAVSVSYSSPLRAAAERYTRKQDLAVDEIDPGGSNLVMYLRSLSQTEARAFREWTQEHLGFGVVPESIRDHVSLNIDIGGDQSYNLTDMGFGYSQVLPIVAQIWDRTEGPGRRRSSTNRYLRGRSRTVVFAIEQPELHLHPALQAKVAELLVRTAALSRKANVRVVFIVETHSSVIVNRIGQLIAEGDSLKAPSAQVLLFDAKTPSLSAVRNSTFDERGVLSDWPYGFFEPDVLEPYPAHTVDS